MGSENNINQKLTSAINNLKRSKESILTKIFTESSITYSSLIFISKSLDNYDIDQYENDIDINLFDSEFIQIICSLLEHLYEVRYELDLAIEFDLDSADTPRNLNERRLFMLGNLIFITYEIEQNSIEICNQMVTCQVLDTFLFFLNDEKFFNLNQYFLVNGDFSDFIDSLMINIFSLRFTGVEFRHLWDKLDAVRIMIKISKLKETCRFLALATVAYICNDTQLENLDEMYLLFEIIVKKFLQCKTHFEKRDFKRIWGKIYFKGELMECETLHANMGNSLKQSLVYLLDCLYRLACNPKLKSKIYFKTGIKDCLKTFVAEGNSIEKVFTLRLLVQLAFSESVRNDLNQDRDVKEFLNNRVFTEDKDIVVLIEKLKWNLKQRERIQGNSNHIVISMSSDEHSLDLSLKLKENLQSNGHKVWHRKNDSSLNERLIKIENSSCVLICLSEGYRQSLSCQIEAKHGVKANKKLIFLVAQSNYQNNFNGWLGTLIEDKKCINFENGFETPFLDLENELAKMKTNDFSIVKRDFKADEIPGNKNGTAISEKINNMNLASREIVTKNVNVEDWKEAELKDWFKKNKLNLSIFEYFRPFNGKMLKQMYVMKQTSSDFFFKSLNNISDVKFNDIVLYSACIDDLFKNNK